MKKFVEGPDKDLRSDEFQLIRQQTKEMSEIFEEKTNSGEKFLNSFMLLVYLPGYYTYAEIKKYFVS